MIALSAIHISSERPKELSAFYQKVLEIDPEWQTDGETSLIVSGVRLIIQGHDQVHSKNSNPERLFFDLLVQDMATEFKRIVALGATVIQEPYSFNEDGMSLMFATFADMDGNYFQLMSMTPASVQA
jgi:predicted enzyme related to lactoylglutathione lyase